MIKIGITGGIGSGKSVVSELFSVMGIPVYDSDSRAKQLMAQSPLIGRQLISLLGEEVFTHGQLNRAYIADRVFNNVDLLGQLNAIVHPVVFSDFEEWCRLYHQSRCVACESAIMYECGLDKIMTHVVLVTAPRELCINRVLSRGGGTLNTRQAVEERMNRQQPEAEKLHRAAYVLHNDGQTPLIPQLLSILSTISDLSRS